MNETIIELAVLFKGIRIELVTIVLSSARCTCSALKFTLVRKLSGAYERSSLNHCLGGNGLGLPSKTCTSLGYTEFLLWLANFLGSSYVGWANWQTS